MGTGVPKQEPPSWEELQKQMRRSVDVTTVVQFHGDPTAPTRADVIVTATNGATGVSCKIERFNIYGQGVGGSYALAPVDRLAMLRLAEEFAVEAIARVEGGRDARPIPEGSG